MREGYNSHLIVIGLVKSISFSALTIFISSFYGFYAKGGAVGVGQATRSAVVVATIAILMVNFLISQVVL